jgi:hypothetical protein
VSLPSRSERLLYPEVDLDAVGAEPTSPASFKVGRLGHPGDAQNARVERLGLDLPARWHRKLNMMECPDHGSTIPGTARREPDIVLRLPAT